MTSIGGVGCEELRARFAGAGTASPLVDGRAVRWEALSVRSMNFGQHWRTPGVPRCRYALELPLAFFVAFLAEGDALPDLIEDAKLRPDPSDELDQALIAAGFPSAEQAVQNVPLAQLLAEFFARDALLRWLGDAGPKEEPGVVLNSCDVVVFSSFGVRIEGEGRTSGSSSAYQDV